MENNKDMNLQAFIRSDQLNYIKFQLKNIVLARLNVKDIETLNALKFYSLDNVQHIFPDLSEQQREILSKIIEIDEEIQAKSYLNELKQYVIPFTNITAKTIRRLFPKIKKLKLPTLEEIDFKEISYLGWDDPGLGRKFLIVEYNGQLMGIEGTFKETNKGICALCNGIEEIGLFMTKVKSGKESYTNKGNYICKDSLKCNQNIMSLDKINHFIEVLKK